MTKVEKYHLFLFFMNEKWFLIGLILNIIESETRKIIVKTISNNNSIKDLYSSK